VVEIGQLGVRSRELAEGDLDEAVGAARALEELGYGAVWLNAAPLLQRGERLAQATERIVFASSVASIWSYEPQELAEAFRRLDDAHPDRFLLGIGISHAPIVERYAPGRVYEKPIESMNAWLDELDALPAGVPREQRILAALAPRMLRLAAERSLGSHPYLVPPAHSRAARELLGPKPLLAPAQVAVVETDASRARELGRTHINNPYMSLPNYTRTWLRYGLEPDDLEHGGSDRLVDELVAWGSADTVAAKLREHLDAGASHVAVQVLGDPFPSSAWRGIAEAFGGA
jgi:probable F420-dependent oxidoreductase